MAKLTLADVSNILGNPTSAASTINANSALIETALENTLSRDGTTPNQMQADFDMNNNDILNVDNIDASVIILDGSILVPSDVTTIPPGSITTDFLADGAVTEPKLAGSLTNLLLFTADTRTSLKALDTTRVTEAYLSESGREGVFKWTVGDFSAHVTADTLEGVYIKADAFATTIGAWVRDYKSNLDIRWFGAILDGTDNGHTTALQAITTLAPVISTKDVILQLPAGDIFLNAELAFTDRNLRVTGAGVSETRLKYTSASSKIKLTSTDTTGTTVNAHRLVVDNLSFFVDVISAAGSGPTAIEGIWSFATSATTERAFFSNVVITSTASGKWWNKGIRLSDAAQVYMDNIQIYNLDGHQTCLSTAAIEIVRDKAANITGFNINNFWFGRFVQGIQFSQASATVGGGTIEGVFISNGSFVNVAYAFHEDNTSSATHFIDSISLTNIHWNASRAGWKAGRTRGLTVCNSHLFHDNFGEPGVAPLEAAFNFLLQAQAIKVQGNPNILRDNVDTSAAPCFLLPTDASTNWVEIDHNTVANWSSLITQAGTPSTTQVKIRIGKNSFVSTPLTAGVGFFDNMTSIGGNGSVATGTVVNFGHTFSAAPGVVAVYRGSSTVIKAWVDTVTTTGFTLRHDGAGSQTFSWVAVGT